MGKHDLPSAINYVLKTQKDLNSSKIFYVGHSMGTVTYWIAANEWGFEFENKIELMIAMGPVG